MTAKGHTLLALPFIVAVDMAVGFGQKELMTFLAFGVLGSLMPDIDEPNSYIGKRSAGIAHILSLFVRHRGATHYLIAPLILAFTGLFAQGLVQVALFGIALGWLAHLAGDMLTVGGIRNFLYPFKKGGTYWLLPKFFRFYTGSFIEFIIIACLLALDFYLISVHLGGIDIINIHNLTNLIDTKKLLEVF